MKIQKSIKIISVLAITVLLTSCYDKIELEDRALVISMGIDKDDDEFSLAMEIPSKLESDEENNKNNVKEASAASVNSAMRKIDAYSGQKLYYGHTKACIIGKDILEDEKMFKETVDGLERNREISRKLIILATKDDADEIYEAKTDNEALTGIFINDFYKNNIKTLGITFRQDLEGIIQQLLSSSNTVIPEIENEEGKLKISSMAVLKNYKLAGFLNEEETRGFLWLCDYPVGGEITVPFENTNSALKISKKETKLNTEKNDEGFYEINCSINIEGNIEEYTLSENIFVDSNKYKILQNEYAEVIKKETENTFGIIQKEYKADIIGFGEMIRKGHYEDYNKMNGKTDYAFEEAVLNVNVNVAIKGAGSIK